MLDYQNPYVNIDDDFEESLEEYLQRTSDLATSMEIFTKKLRTQPLAITLQDFEETFSQIQYQAEVIVGKFHDRH